MRRCILTSDTSHRQRGEPSAAPPPRSQSPRITLAEGVAIKRNCRTHLFVKAASDGADYDAKPSAYCCEERYRGSCACTLMVDRRPDKRTRSDAHNASNNCSYNGVRCAARVSSNPLVELEKQCAL
jgi:hypothetical protein